MKCEHCGTEYHLHKGRNEHEGEECIKILCVQRDDAERHQRRYLEERDEARERARKWMGDACDVKVRADLAERQRDIAVEALRKITSEAESHTHAHVWAHDALAAIEQVKP